MISDYYSVVPRKYAGNPTLVAKWPTMSLTARQRVTQGLHVVCEKCNSDWTQHNTGTCQSCRTIQCEACGRKVIVKFKLFTHCGMCAKAKRADVRRKDAGALA